ncbi:hydrolase [Alsobacter metallidurans]|uniref:Hydrolase n=1 Tax=Alsobacter metallidurans TaxID=340221 RepID=A0A917I7U7_9HYPH|nr:alpha/beta hydrolase [Alsobacter metallidurans]GGH22270.1 hydrolase [Alsobacter metallidurans]
MTTPLVFIPGLNCTAALFGPQAERLREGRPVIFADTTQDATISAMAGRLLADAPARFALAGLSMGGYVALELLRLAPHRVAGVALMDTNARPDAEEAVQRRLQLVDMAETGAFEDVHRALWPRLVHPDRIGDAALEAIVWEMMLEVGPTAFMRQQRAIIGRMDSRPFLKNVTQPALVLVGEQDAITPLVQAEEMHGLLPDAELVVVPQSGHLSSLEQPEHVLDALTAWLARIPDEDTPDDRAHAAALASER